MNPILNSIDFIARSPGGVALMRKLVLELAVRGKLVPQDPKDEPASVLLERIKREKARLVKEGKIKAGKELPEIKEEEKPYELPRGWEWMRLGEICIIVRGIVFPSNEKFTVPEPGRVACIRTANVQKDIDYSDLLYIKETFVNRDDKYLADGDVVMSMANSRELVGKVAIAKSITSRITFGGFLGVLRGVFISSDYLAYFFSCPGTRNAIIDSASQTTNIANISLGKLNPLPFPLPPLAEQSRIVARVQELMAVLDRLEDQANNRDEERNRALIAATQAVSQAATPEEIASSWLRLATDIDRLVDRAEDVKTIRAMVLELAVRGKLVPQDPKDEPASVLLERIKREKARLVKEGKIKAGKELPEIKEEEKPYELPKGWEWVRLNEVFNNYDGKRIPVSEDIRTTMKGEYPYYGASGVIDRVNKYLFDTPSLLIGEDGANLINRSTPIAFIAKGKYWVNNHAHVLKSLGNTPLEYWELCLNSIDLKPYVTGTAQPKMNQAKMNSIILPLPPLAEQSRIVARVQKLMAVLDRLEEKLAARDKAAILASEAVAKMNQAL